jgi:hypothetical protein
MNGKKRTGARRAIFIAAVLAAALSPLHARAAEAGGDATLISGDLGITGISGSMTIHARTGRTRFYSEPEVMSIDPTGPASGRILEGDIIVAIDDYLITSEEGSRRFSDPPIDEPVRLTVRRAGRERSITLTARESERPTPPPRPEPRPVPAPGAAPEEPVLPFWEGHPTKWLGFGLRCSMTGTLKPVDGEGRTAWQFTSTPKIISVYPGSPADSSDLKIGDVILEIDGIDIDTPEAAVRLSEIEPGDVIKWTVRKWLRTRTVEMVATEMSPFAHREEEDAPAWSGRTIPAASDVQFLGSMGDILIEVRAPEGAHTTVDETPGEIRIVVGEGVVVLRSAE